jgi:predicted lactoylglutathione lyase
MSTKFFVNLPVSDLGTSIDFFTKLGFSFQPDFTNDDAGCLVIGEDVYAMLVTEHSFKTFARKDIADTARTAETILALQVDSRERVDELVDAALASGGQSANDPDDQGFMYSRNFQDPDGHLWSVLHMDPAAAQPTAASAK